MERFTITVVRGAETQTIPASGGESILNALRAKDYREPDAPCGGQGTCKKCLVTVTGRVKSVEGFGERDVENAQLLACRYCPAGDLTVTLTEKQKLGSFFSSRSTSVPFPAPEGPEITSSIPFLLSFISDLLPFGGSSALRSSRASADSG